MRWLILLLCGCASTISDKDISVSVKAKSLQQMINVLSKDLRFRSSDVSVVVKTVKRERSHVEVIGFDYSTLIKYSFPHCKKEWAEDLSQTVSFEIMDYNASLGEITEKACNNKDNIRDLLCK